MPDGPSLNQTQSFLMGRFAQAGIHPRTQLGQNFLIDLNLVRVKWSLSRGLRRLSNGTSSLSLPPHAHGPIRLSLPGDALAAADTLRIDFDHPDGWNVLTCRLVLKPTLHSPPEIKPVQGVRFPRFNLLTGKNVENEVVKGWHHLEGKTGELVNLKVQMADGSAADMSTDRLAATPLTQVRSLDADVVLKPGAAQVGHVQAECSGGKMSYRFTWTGAKSDIFELGWIFSAPKGLERFSWDRRAVWSWYPPDHIGRPAGSATPASADVELTRVDRPDAFDFNSTKFDCNWASLTDAQGRGLCLAFSPEQRQHVRGAINADGTCGLVVNRCYSPPRDISSRVVQDLYTVLKPGDQVTGSFQLKGVAFPD